MTRQVIDQSSYELAICVKAVSLIASGKSAVIGHVKAAYLATASMLMQLACCWTVKAYVGNAPKRLIHLGLSQAA